MLFAACSDLSCIASIAVGACLRSQKVAHRRDLDYNFMLDDTHFVLPLASLDKKTIIAFLNFPNS